MHQFDVYQQGLAGCREMKTVRHRALFCLFFIPATDRQTDFITCLTADTYKMPAVCNDNAAC